MQADWNNDELFEAGIIERPAQEIKRRRENGLRLNKSRDLPLLIAIRNATFISHQQLFELLAESGTEQNVKALYWRIDRFIRGNYIASLANVPPYQGRVYTITRFGLGVLESFGEGLIGFGSDIRSMPNRNQAPHFLELNEIRNAFTRTGKIVRWRSERELTSMNYVIGTPLAKDYDAVVDLNFKGKTVRIAIEYERVDKAYARYQEIQKVLRNETQVDLVLYLTAQLEMVFRVFSEFNNAGIPMAFAPARSFLINQFGAVARFAFMEMRETISISEAIELAISMQE